MRSGWIQWLRLVGLVIHHRLNTWMFFAPNVALNFAGVLVTASTLYFMANTSGGLPAALGQGLSYGAYILVGMMFATLARVATAGFHEACLDGYWGMEFDVYLQHPAGISAYLAGSVIFKYAIALVNTGLYFAACVWIFRVPMAVPEACGLFVLVLAGIVALTGLGLAEASTFGLLNMRARGGNVFGMALDFAVVLLAGVYFPASVLPAWLAPAAEWLPHTHALRMLRLYLTGQQGIESPQIAADLRFLLLFALAALPVGALLFAVSLRKARREGLLTRWS